MSRKKATSKESRETSHPFMGIPRLANKANVGDRKSQRRIDELNENVKSLYKQIDNINKESKHEIERLRRLLEQSVVNEEPPELSQAKDILATEPTLRIDTMLARVPKMGNTPS